MTSKIQHKYLWQYLAACSALPGLRIGRPARSTPAEAASATVSAAALQLALPRRAAAQIQCADALALLPVHGLSAQPGALAGQGPALGSGLPPGLPGQPPPSRLAHVVACILPGELGSLLTVWEHARASLSRRVMPCTCSDHLPPRRD